MTSLTNAKQTRPALAFLSGITLAAAFPYPSQLWLAWLVPGWVLLLGLGQPGKTAFRAGFFAGLGFYLTSLYWLLLIPMPLPALAAWLGLSIYLAFFPATWCWLCCRCFPKRAAIGKNPTATVTFLTGTSWRQRAGWTFFCGAAWVAMEMGIAHILTGFPWNLLGVSQQKFLPLLQIASITGVYGVAFLIVWFSAALAVGACVAVRSSRQFTSLAREIVLPALAVTGAIIFGCVRLSSPPASDTVLKLALIQPAIPQPVIWDPNENTNRLNKLLELSRAALMHKPDLLVWPEAALPDLVTRSRATQEMVTDLVRRHNVWMIFGGEDFGRKPAADGTLETHRFNTAFLVNPAGDLVARHHKRRLVVFTEYMPAVRWLPFLKWLRATGGGYEAGTRLTPFRLESPRVNIAMSICFEDVFPHLTRESVNRDTDFLLNLTNDGWCGESATQWQHADVALFRAIENGVPLVRCTNNGLTCWVDAQGRRHAVYFPDSKNIYQAGFKLVELPLPSPAGRTRTIYHRFGDWFGWSGVALTLGMLLRSYFPFRRSRKA